jgi:hypothetical protein
LPNLANRAYGGHVKRPPHRPADLSYGGIVHSFRTAVPVAFQHRTGAVLGTALAAVTLSAVSVLPAVAGHAAAAVDGPTHRTAAAASVAASNEIDWP